MSISLDLIDDFNECALHLKESSPKLTQNYDKGSLVVFEPISEKHLTQSCADLLGVNDGVTLTVKETPEASSAWKRFGKDTVFYTLTSCTIQCVPHSKREEMQNVDLDAFTDSRIPKFKFDIDEGCGIYMSASMPWILKEGRVKAFVITLKNPKGFSKKMEEESKPPSAVSKPTTPKSEKGSKPAPKGGQVLSYPSLSDLHNELKARIAKLDQRVWSDQGANAKTLQQYEASINEASDKGLLKKYANSLATLASRIEAAEKDTSLPGLLKSLKEVHDILSDESNLKHIKANTRARLQKDYEKLANMEQNLVGKAKAVGDLLNEVRGFVSSPPAGGGGNPIPKGDKAKALSIPQIEEDVLSPYVIDHADGPDGYRTVLSSLAKDGTNFATMVQALKNPELSALYEKWKEQRTQVSGQVQLANRDPTQTVDVTLFVAYGEALRQVFEETKRLNNPVAAEGGSKNGAAGVTKQAPKTIKCEECEGRKRPFEGSKLCKECWSGHNLKVIIEGLETRADYLSRKVTKEKKEPVDDEEKDEENILDPRGPFEKLYDEYCDLNEELMEAYDAFEKPNSSTPAWEKLKGLIAKADALLPHKPGERVQDDDEEDAYEPGDVDDMMKYSDESSSSPEGGRRTKKSKKHYSSEEEEDDEEEEEEESLSHKALLTLHRIPVQSVHEDLLDAYAEGRYTLVEERLKSLENVKEVYGFKVVELYEEEGKPKRGEPEEFHTYFLKESDRNKVANTMRIKDKTDIEKITRPVVVVAPPEGGGDDNPQKSKKKKHNDNDDDDE